VSCLAQGLRSRSAASVLVPGGPDSAVAAAAVVGEAAVGRQTSQAGRVAVH
jgi:hypothetical protein